MVNYTKLQEIIKNLSETTILAEDLLEELDKNGN